MSHLANEDAILARYSPYVWLHAEEQHTPSAVDWFLERTKLVTDTGEIKLNPAGSGTQLGRYRPHDDRKYFLELLNQADRRGTGVNAPVYGTVLPDLNSSGIVASYDLSYWFFYPFNGNIFDLLQMSSILSALKDDLTKLPKDSQLAGFPLSRIDDAIRSLQREGTGTNLRQLDMHEGDWEHITVRLDISGQNIQAIYFAQHSGGQWLAAGDAELEFLSGHPVVYSAKESHASYPSVGDGKKKRFGGFANDHVSRGVLWQPRVINVGHDTNAPMNGQEWLKYQGRWGRRESAPIAAFQDIVNAIMEVLTVGGKAASGVVDFAAAIEKEGVGVVNKAGHLLHLPSIKHHNKTAESEEQLKAAIAENLKAISGAPTHEYVDGPIGFPFGTQMQGGVREIILNAGWVLGQDGLVIPDNPGWSDGRGWGEPQFYSTMQCADVDGDGRAEVLARGSAGIEVWKCDPATRLWTAMPPGPGFSDAGGWNHHQYYSTIQCADIDGDRCDEILARGAGGLVLWKCNPSTLAWQQMGIGPFSDGDGWSRPEYYSTIQGADIDGDGCDEIVARGAGGIVAFKWNRATNALHQLAAGPGWSDAAGWNRHEYFLTIQCADVDGDGCAEVLARGAAGMTLWKYDPQSNSWRGLSPGPALSDAGGWLHHDYFSTIQCADIDGDGCDEIIARGAGGIIAFKLDRATSTWHELPNGPAWSDAGGWNRPEYYTTIQCADIDGDGCDEILARGAGGLIASKFDPQKQTWRDMPLNVGFGDAGGWNHAAYYATIQCADVDGDARNRAELVARGIAGVVTFWLSGSAAKSADAR